MGGCNNCRCLAGGRPGCTRRLCGDRATWEEGRSCSEGARWEEKTGDKIRICSCEGGKPECNSLVIITEAPEVRCLDDAEVSHAEGESWEQEGGGICTCQGDGSVECSEQVIRSSSQQCLDLVEGEEGVALELQSLPKITQSRGFSLPFLLSDGGEGNIVIGSSGSIFGSIKPLDQEERTIM